MERDFYESNAAKDLADAYAREDKRRAAGNFDIIAIIMVVILFNLL
jgi:hypothetical protein